MRGWVESGTLLVSGDIDGVSSFAFCCVGGVGNTGSVCISFGGSCFSAVAAGTTGDEVFSTTCDGGGVCVTIGTTWEGAALTGKLACVSGVVDVVLGVVVVVTVSVIDVVVDGTSLDLESEVGALGANLNMRN